MPPAASWPLGWLAVAIGLPVAAVGFVLIRRARRGRGPEPVRVRVDFPEGSPWADWLKAEVLWSVPLGGDLYEVGNFPFHAPGLHFGDVVRAVADEPGGIPRVAEVVRRGGCRTIRVLFAPEVPEPDRHAMLASLNPWRASYENGDDRLFAVSLHPGADFRAVHERLAGWEREGMMLCDPPEAARDAADPPLG